MNVNDYADVEVPAGDMLQTIFNHQRDLMDKYHKIEEANVGHLPSIVRPTKGWLYAGSLDINDRASQLRLKDFAWRITEELTEATLARGEEDETHYLEELIDALHFSVELLILCGIEPEELVTDIDGDIFESAFRQSSCSSDKEIKKYCEPAPFRKEMQAYMVIEELGEAMNRLKLKPWKTTAMLTDGKAFRISLITFFAALIDLLKASGFTAKSATAMYLRKNSVNKFRIGSNY